LKLLLGFDPGGRGHFGWAVAEYAAQPPIELRASGCTDDAEAAIHAVRMVIDPGESVLCAGIDSPMYWTPSCSRASDQIVRRAIDQLGAPSPGGTVQHINSLRGACVVQGIVCGFLLRTWFGPLPITEAHPKALLWMLGIATNGRPPAAVGVSDLLSLVSSRSSSTEHERDAVLAVVTAWAMLVQPKGWIDLLREEVSPILPIPEPLGYWMPIRAL